MRRLVWLGLGFAAMAAGLPALAQDAPSVQPGDGRNAAEALISRSREVFGRPPRPRCGVPDANGDIVVCAPDNAPYRIPSTTASDPASRAGTRTGALAPPQLGRGSCRGKPGCLIGGRAPPPIYIFDLKSIPETPKGSDAEKVANGEISDR